MSLRPSIASSIRHIAAAAMLLGLAACAINPPAAQPQTAQLPQPPLLQPGTLGGSRDTQQILRAAFGGHEAVLRCVVRASPQQIEVVALTALGQRAMSVIWDGQNWKVETAPMVPSQLRPEWLLADLQLALWPLAQLQQAYQPAGWEVTEPGGGVRRLRHDGQLIAEVAYADADPWHGRYWISNFRSGYALAIAPDPQEDAK